MSWDKYSHKVMVLVGDAPPQGFTPAAVPERDVHSNSPLFSGAFDENVETIRKKIEEKRIRFYALGVGNDPEMEDSFRQIVGSSRTGGFRVLADADAFIAQLEEDLREQREEQARTGRIAEGAIQRVRSDSRPSDLSDTEIFILHEKGLSPERLEELVQNRIQKGWFDVDAALTADRVSVCVYLRRRDLEATLMELGGAIITDEELEILKRILEPYVGKESLRNVHNINDLLNLVKDLPLPPDVMQQIVARGYDTETTRILRTKMNNILILLLQRELFNNYEEGWIPMEYLPGSLSTNN